MFGREDEKRWLVRSQRTLTENPWFRVLARDVVMPNGRSTAYFSIEYTGPAVGIVPRRPGGILLVRQYRFLVDEFVWAIPSGGVGKGESLEAAALREMEEETGHRGSAAQHLLSYYPSYGSGNQRFEIFTTADAEPTGAGFDTDEVLEVRWFEIPDVARMLAAGEIKDGLSLTPLLLLAAREGWLV